MYIHIYIYIYIHVYIHVYYCLHHCIHTYVIIIISICVLCPRSEMVLLSRDSLNRNKSMLPLSNDT